MHNNPDLISFSDGSGHEDGFGGWAAVVVTPDRILKQARMGCASGTTTDRCEMIGFLEGLEMALQMANDLPRSHLGDFRPRVQCFSDRENLVLSAMGLQRQSNSPDLWARFRYYQELLDIHVAHINREQETIFPEFRECDLQASTGRIIVKQDRESVRYGTR